jgi:hypothetical protein
MPRVGASRFSWEYFYRQIAGNGFERGKKGEIIREYW